MEKIIKSKERVKQYAEVFTPQWLVKDMCDLIPSEEWENVDSTFLEPCCGNGNFLEEIAKRKFKLCKSPKDGIRALNSIYGIDIQEDNVIESRERLLRLYIESFPTANDFAILIASQVINGRIKCGDSLKIMREWTENKQWLKDISSSI